MQRLSDLEAWRDYAHEVRALGRRVGLVPTMGALHQGHASLFRAAKSNGDVVLATLFVNPRQFNNATDLAAYPRTPEADAEMAERNGVDCLVEPSLGAIWPDYPEPTPTTVSVHGIGDLLEGAGRPGHFDGVASIVAKLFAITGPCRTYFGEKDFQQICVVRQMARDLAFDVDVVSCPIVRDDDGLAISSRNVRLSVEGRASALALSRGLALAGAEPATASEHRRHLEACLSAAGVATSYVEVVDPVTLVASSDNESGVHRALVAGVVDHVRLIDNGPVTLRARSS